MRADRLQIPGNFLRTLSNFHLKIKNVDAHARVISRRRGRELSDSGRKTLYELKMVSGWIDKNVVLFFHLFFLIVDIHTVPADETNEKGRMGRHAERRRVYIYIYN